MIFYSVLTLDELKSLSKEERCKYIGVIKDDKIISPAHCYECGSDIIVLDMSSLSQCPSCGIVNDLYFYDNINPYFAHKIKVEFKGTKLIKE